MDGVVSDLFFNHEHPRWSAAMKMDKDGNLAGDPDKAIQEDAAEFVQFYGSVIIGCPTPDELATDFVERV